MPRKLSRNLSPAKIKKNKVQCKQYNRGTKNLAPLKAGDSIRMKKPGEQKWSLGHCTRPLDRRSYEVEVDGRRFRRNRRQLRSTLEPPAEPGSQIEEPHQTENEIRPPVLPESLQDQNQTHPTPEIQANDPMCPAQSVADNAEPIPDAPLSGLKIMTNIEHLISD